jgi:hypothetical protein
MIQAARTNVNEKEVALWEKKAYNQNNEIGLLLRAPCEVPVWKPKKS